ncbi:RNA binding protein, heterogenous nuclear RNP-K like protein [Rhodotorula kratochvilovae]
MSSPDASSAPAPAAPAAPAASSSSPQGPPANTPAAAPTAATIANSANPDAYEGIHQPGQTEDDGLTLRALVSSKEAGVIIGRGGATIAQIRQDANVKAGVSKVVPGVPDRVLSIGGTVESVAKAYSLVAQTILENPVPSPTSPTAEGAAPSPSASASIRLLISHLLIGSVIGKGGSKIRQIQELASARMVASKEMLPQSTERIVEVTGQPDGVRLAVQEIAKCLIDDWDRSQGTVLYHPGAEGLGGAGAPGQQQQQQGNGYPAGGAYPQQQGQRAPRAPMGGAPGGFRNNGAPGGAQRGGRGPAQGAQQGGGAPFAPGQPQQPQQGLAGTVVGSESDPNWREQKISIPSDMVGCIIGRGGTKINEIRRLSGSRINIAKTAHDETGERMFVISGLPENNEKALFLLYNQLESEKERRVQSVQEEQAAQQQQQQQQQQAEGGAAGEA